MKSRADLVRLWLLKAEGDLRTVELLISLKQSFDIACFHAQQAIEKYFKAYLIHNRVKFPFVHDLEILLELCCSVDSSLIEAKRLVEGLTQYATRPRYDPDFWPAIERAKSARDAALKVRGFVLARLPAEVHPNLEERG